MREDLAKCTTEHPRAGARGKCYKTHYGGKVEIHPDPDHDYLNEFGGYRSSARRRHWNYKEFTDVLAPLRGNLRANLGRRWDDVYSEFCQVLDRRGLSGYHIWTHLKQEVILHTFMLEGKVCEKGVRYPYRLKKYGGGIVEVSGFYVHPETGILEYKEPDYGWRDHGDRRPGDITVPGDEAWVYRQIDGLWFRVQTVMVTGVEVYKSFFGTERVREKQEEVILARRSANKREIAWIGKQRTESPK